jgi:hypothetical protein
MESVEFKLSLYGHGFDDRWPQCRVLVNDTEFFDGVVNGDLDVNFTVDLEDDTKNKLIIDYYNRDFKKDVVLGSDGMPVKYTAIYVNNLEMDGINLAHTPYTNSYQEIYEPWYLEQNRDNFPNPRREDMQISWNGQWILEFTSPIYIWLLENL